MVGDDPEGDVSLTILTVILTGKYTDLFHEPGKEIAIKVCTYPLDGGCDTLKPHTGVDTRAGEGFENTALVTIVLHEDQVPELKVPVTIAAHAAIRPSTAYLRALVEDDLRARAAGAGIPHGPEVVLFSQAHDAFFRQPGDLLPELGRLVVVAEDGHVKAINWELKLLGQELPGKGNGLFLEVIAKGEVPEHLEEGVMPGGVAYIFEVVVFTAGTHALLARSRPLVRTLLLPEKDLLELHHTGIGEKKGWVICRHQRGTRDYLVPVPGKVVQKELSYLLALKIFHRGLLNVFGRE